MLLTLRVVPSSTGTVKISPRAVTIARLPLAVFVGWLAYAEKIDIWVLVGAMVIFGGNYLNVRAEGRRRAQ